MDRRTAIKTIGSSVASLSLAGCLNKEIFEEESETPSSVLGQNNSLDHNTSYVGPDSSGTVEVNVSGDGESTPSAESDQPDYSHLMNMGGDTSPDDSVSGLYERKYEWSGVGGKWTFTLNIPKRLEQYYDQRLRTNHRGQFVSDRYDDDLISEIAGAFEELGNEHDLSDREVVDLATAFVQQLKYTSDKAATGFSQYTKYPVETLIDRGGDCEDTVVLLSAILTELGYGTVLLAFWEEEHMALGVAGKDSIPGVYYEYNGTRYYYLETTAEGWKVGDVPDELESASAEIQEINTQSSLVYEWNVSGAQRDTLYLDFTIQNKGLGTASNLGIAVKAESDEESLLANNEKSLEGLPPKAYSMTSIGISGFPDDQPVRLVTYVLTDGTAQDIDKSGLVLPV